MLREPRDVIVDLRVAAVLQDHRIRALPVCPFAIATELEIVVEKVTDAAPGYSGMLVRNGDDFGILYSAHVKSEGFQRFSVAHELGHYFLPGHPEAVLAHGAHRSRAGFASADPYEREADRFAAGLLMPAELFRAAARPLNAGMAALLALKALCRTSITATAISFARHAEEPVAVILSQGGRVEACWCSPAMRERRARGLGKGAAVPLGTPTARYWGAPLGHPEALDGPVDLVDWFDRCVNGPAQEEVVGLGVYGRALTLIVAEPLADEDEAEETEDEVEARWTPRFR